MNYQTFRALCPELLQDFVQTDDPILFLLQLEELVASNRASQYYEEIQALLDGMAEDTRGALESLFLQEPEIRP